MPCYQTNLISVDFTAADKSLLKKAAAAVGLLELSAGVYQTMDGSTITLTGNKAVCSNADLPLVNKLRVQYSKETISQAALKLGWQKVATGENKFVVKKGV